MMGGPKIINSPQRVVGLMETFSIMRIKFEASFEICVILNPQINWILIKHQQHLSFPSKDQSALATISFRVLAQFYYKFCIKSLSVPSWLSFFVLFHWGFYHNCEEIDFACHHLSYTSCVVQNWKRIKFSRRICINSIYLWKYWRSNQPILNHANSSIFICESLISKQNHVYHVCLLPVQGFHSSTFPLKAGFLNLDAKCPLQKE